VRESRVFSLNVLAADQKALAQEFFREIERTDGRFASHPFERGARTGCPLFPELPAALECEVAEIVEGGGDHAVVVAHVVDAVHRREAKPLTHAETGWTYAG
jgi:flavin reductase (DIM6/NTAB) family NADH-FMN oxidoreductase RutF